ncbi:uncharacterized protein LOC413907 isoform X3 [Apis mellifera]|uniref:Uncharacterized protein LOC413907 isoform X3 n=1 Tax=Apis mellifera TaxID=7460 RepID=A0A7M7MRE6_APIME|nr:uncharacterized protein LOC413907 isoform X3 [Apis mellifera]|eukprot:XP_026299628.1 uncharacterized protein LOC413907 isoform X3 [Apis mellifera]
MFEECAKIFRILLANWRRNNSQLHDNENLEDLILPSNEDWRYRVYYQLVELQRESDAIFIKNRVNETRLETETKLEVRCKKNEWEWEPKRYGYSFKAKPSQQEGLKGKSSTNVDGSMIEMCIEPGWRLNDILLAAKVLRKTQPPPIYSDEAEMRRVFGLVYDVFRYKKIFIRALEDAGFWQRNRAIKNEEKIVWLLLYDMQGRKFSKPRFNNTTFEERENIFKAAGLTDIDNALSGMKIHLAASISRLRIRGSALKLDELLPSHLRDIEGVTWGIQTTVASGWINTMKIVNKEEFLKEMSELKLKYCETNKESIELEENEFAFDPICPKIIYLHESKREMLAVSELVCNHRFVFLERSLCLGAATLAQVIRNCRFYGPVILTHSLAPRHTGYLAGLLADIEYAGKLLVFGAGDRRCEYESYLKDLDVTLQQCRVFSEKYVSHLSTIESERATVVLAVPTCTYTGVRDIVDLAVARGGDVDLLESLTNNYIHNNNNNNNNNKYYKNQEQWHSFLSDQMSTLKYALTRPNVQFLIYEVHTILPSETTQMVQEVVDCVNQMAKEKYFREYPIPDTDLFEVGNIDDIYGQNVSHMLDPGCFLAIIKRKEMMQFDSLFMIKVAESKDLFGTSKAQQQSKHDIILNRAVQTSQSSTRKRAKRIKVEMERLMAHTYSSLSKAGQENQICPRHKHCSNWSEGNECQFNFKAWRKEKRNVSHKPLYVSSSRHKELQGIRKIFSARSESNASTSRDISKQDKSSSILTNLLSIESLQRQEWNHTTPSSTILRSPILARAVRLIPLEDSINIEECEEIKKQTRSKMGHRYWTSSKPSRLLHPIGSHVFDPFVDII